MGKRLQLKGANLVGMTAPLSMALVMALVMAGLVLGAAGPVAALTFKSDGSVVQSSGKVVKKSFADRFKEQFSNPNPTEWAFADGKEENPKGYFGNDVLLPGTPLLRISKINKGEDYLLSLAEKNGFADKSALQRFIISNAAPQFLEDLDLGEDQAINYVAAGVASANNLGGEYAQMVASLQSVALEVSANVEEAVAKQVEESVSEQVEESVSEAIEEAVSYSLESWIDSVIEWYEQNGYTDIYVTEDPVYGTIVGATCPDGGCG